MGNKAIYSGKQGDAESLLVILQQISLILDPLGDGLKYTVTRSLNSDDCGALARLLDVVDVTDLASTVDVDGGGDTLGGDDDGISVYRMSKNFY